MVFISKKSVLSGIRVQEAMRRQVIALPAGTSIKRGISALIKYKVNAVLVTSQHDRPEGVVSGTDFVAAFYAGLPLESSLDNILSSPLVTCFPDDELEAGLDLMRENQVHQVYVQGEKPESIIGLLAYYDIVGLLYRYCRACKRSTFFNEDLTPAGGQAEPGRIQEVMTRGVASCHSDQGLERIIETLSENRFGAVLMRTDQAEAAGVISKTDLVLAYSHGLSLETRGGEIMNSPVLACEQSDLLMIALQSMLLRDTKRVFVYHTDPEAIVGLVSLSDAARFRSGSCQACRAGRMVSG